MRDGRGAYRVWVGRPEEKIALGKSGRRWWDNIRIDFQQAEWRIISWIDLVQARDRW